MRIDKTLSPKLTVKTLFLQPFSEPMDNTVTLLDKTFVRYISSDDVDNAIDRIANQLNKDYENEEPVILVTLNGAIIFAADVIKRLTFNCKVTCVKLSSYAGVQCTNSITSLIGLNEDLTGKRVIIMEDIIDTGNTYEHLAQILTDAHVKDFRIATMTYKPEAYKKELPIHYIGISIPDRFVVGRGLDYDGYGRNLPDIYQLANV